MTARSWTPSGTGPRSARETGVRVQFPRRSTVEELYSDPGFTGVADAGPHAVTQVSLSEAYGGGTRTLSYDDAGNLISGNNSGSSLGTDAFGARYDHDQLPVYLYRGSTTVLSYGPDGERTRQTSAEGNWTWVGAFERSLVGTASERRVYVGNHTQLSTRSGATGVQVSNLLTDRLGSVAAIADATGTLRETRGYDAFGKPRQGTWADANALPSVARTTRGFTQHVHLDGARLIHMNGRAYDYQLGRFPKPGSEYSSRLKTWSKNCTLTPVPGIVP